MQRTKVCHVYSSDELIRALRQLRIVCKNSFQEKKLLIIIDSLPAVIFKVSIDKFLLIYIILEYIDSLLFIYQYTFIVYNCLKRMAFFTNIILKEKCFRHAVINIIFKNNTMALLIYIYYVNYMSEKYVFTCLINIESILHVCVCLFKLH